MPREARSEPADLAAARRCLAQAEADLCAPGATAQLEQGLALLEDVIAEQGAGAAGRTARNLAARYAALVYERVGALLAADAHAPEPLLEQLFALVLAFDRSSVELPRAARALKIDVVRRLVDRYYEGHPPASKERALRELERLAGEDEASV